MALGTGNYFYDLAAWIEYQISICKNDPSVVIEKVRLSLLEASEDAAQHGVQPTAEADKITDATHSGG